MLASTARAASRRAASAASSARGLQTVTLPDLPYDYGALEPVISGEIMQLHHAKHHAAYVAGLNAAAEKYAAAEAKNDVQTMLSLQQAIKFNGGGHVNHSLFWQNLCPPDRAAPPTGALEAAIHAEFGSVGELQARLSAAGAGIQGSGWAWLGYDPAARRLALGVTANQDPAVTVGLVPLLGIDCWEHAYYLQYKNVRPDYLKKIWEVVNWADVGARYDKAVVGGKRE